jgi:hypothetical protein
MSDWTDLRERILTFVSETENEAKMVKRGYDFDKRNQFKTQLYAYVRSLRAATNRIRQLMLNQ